MLLPNHQRGGIAISIAIAALMLSAAAMSEYSAWLGGISSAARQRNAQAYVDKAALAITQWYITHPVEMDAGALPEVAACSLSVGRCLLRASGIPFEHNVVVSPGPQTITAQGYAYRALTVWIPRPNVTGAARSLYTPKNAFVSARVNGYAIEMANWVRANQQANALAGALESAYGAWLSGQGDVANNWFEPSGCGYAGVNENMACSTRWTNAKKAGVDKAAGWAGPWTNPWGLALQVCNTNACGANDVGEPFTLLISSRTPWGGIIRKTVIEPLSS